MKKAQKQTTIRPRTLCTRVILCVLALTVATPAYGLSSSDYPAQNILIYSKGSGACSTTGTSVSGDGNIAKIYNYLVEKGLSAAQAGGILGNLSVEGGFSATRHEVGQAWDKGGYGIAQWTGGRRTVLVDAIKKTDASLMAYYTEKYGGGTTKATGYVADGLPADISDKILQIELDFLYQESTNRDVRHDIDTGAKGKTEWDSIKQATDVTDSARIWYYNFERPATQNETGVNQRAQRGRDALKEIGVNETSTGTVGGGCTMSANGSVAALQSYVKKYAWPTDKGWGFVTPTDGYKQAIEQGQKDKLHVGGNTMPGIDCDGYVTLLMHYSGWDTTFNYDGAGGATGSPTEKGTEWYWLENNWDKVGTDGHVTDTSKLQPGDVAMEDGHTWVFVGTIDGFGSNQSSAALEKRAPMASSSAEMADGLKATTTWYRKKGTVQGS